MREERADENTRAEYLEKLQKEERKNIKAYHKQSILDGTRRKYSELWSTPSAKNERAEYSTPPAGPPSAETDLFLIAPAALLPEEVDESSEEEVEKDPSEK